LVEQVQLKLQIHQEVMTQLMDQIQLRTQTQDCIQAKDALGDAIQLITQAGNLGPVVGNGAPDNAGNPGYAGEGNDSPGQADMNQPEEPGMGAGETQGSFGKPEDAGQGNGNGNGSSDGAGQGGNGQGGNSQGSSGSGPSGEGEQGPSENPEDGALLPGFQYFLKTRTLTPAYQMMMATPDPGDGKDQGNGGYGKDSNQP
jgi:hypothetical protein